MTFTIKILKRLNDNQYHHQHHYYCVIKGRVFGDFFATLYNFCPLLSKIQYNFTNALMNESQGQCFARSRD